jgi:DNA-directed RNA polymerase subunit N (RpoN/RPB10)
MDKLQKAGKKNEEEDYNYFGDIHTKEILDDLGLTRYCCRRMLLSTSDLMNII